MMILKFEGKYDGYAWPETIGGRDFLRELSDAKFNGSVTLAIADERFDGDLYAYGGQPGYSEYTPAEPAELTVGPHNMMDILDRYQGKIVTLWVADEPVNTLADA